MTTSNLTRVLCVDDDAGVLEGLARNLRQRFHISTASNGEEGLKVLQNQGPFAIIITDLRMPGMDGIGFLARVREIAPETVRILLTGQADLDAAIRAVNEGHVFRFLSKPCPFRTMLAAVEAAAEQYRLVTSERVLLEETLQGSVKALMDILALVNPVAFGRAIRVRKSLSRLLDHLGIREHWPIEVAAMLSQIGYVTLPVPLLEKLNRGGSLTGNEQLMVERMPTVTEQLLEHIPRLEKVRKILKYQQKRFDGCGAPRDGVSGEAIPWGARALKIALDVDALEAQGFSTELAIDALRVRTGWYDHTILEALANASVKDHHQSEVQQLPLHAIQEGMILAEDVRAKSGLLLIARGQEVTAGLVERIKNLTLNTNLEDPVLVITRRSTSAD